MRLASAFLILILFLPFSAKSQSVCRDIFLPTLERIDVETRGLLLKGRTIKNVKSELGLVKRWKLSMIESRLRDREPSQLAGDLHLLLVSPRWQALDLFGLLKNGDRYVQAWAERAMLQNGIKSVVPDVETSLIKKAQQRVMAKLPERVLFFKDREISRDLLSRVLDHGVRGEMEALRRAYGTQREVDFARALKPYANLVAYALAGYLMQLYFDHTEVVRGEQLIVETSATEAGLDELIAELKKPQ